MVQRKKKLWILQTDKNGDEKLSLTFGTGILNKISQTDDRNFITVGENDGMGVVYKFSNPITDIEKQQLLKISIFPKIIQIHLTQQQ